MQVYNRSAITITYKLPFINWHNGLFPNHKIEEGIIGESTTFLIDSSFDDKSKIIEKHFKLLFETALEAMWTEEEDWPQKRTFKLFCEWFHYEISDWVYDLSSKPLKSGGFL